MDLAQSIKQYYFDNLEKLPPDKQFHFASRIAAWEGDPRALDVLANLKSFMVPDPTADGLVKPMRGLVNQPQTGRRNADELRQPYFQKYPLLWGVHLALFRVRHLKVIYGINALPALFKVVSRQQLDEMSRDLIKDESAVLILSTFAVNFLYLYKQILLGDKGFMHPDFFMEISRGYDLADKTEIQLMIYLFTHCIIGESNFYTDRISQPSLLSYRKMLAKAEEILSDNYSLVNLDNKLEFLVCCRICRYDTDLFKRVWRECERSISHEGRFLIDAANSVVSTSRKAFESSEHRNVLYIMSLSDYEPVSSAIN